MAMRKRQDNLLVKELGEEVAVYDERADKVHQLNPTAALVWQECDGQATAADIAATLSARTKLPADEEIVRLALHQLDSAGLLEGTENLPAGMICRRSLIQRLGLAGSVALLLPVVTSIVAPTAAMAASPPSPFAPPPFLPPIIETPPEPPGPILPPLI